MLTVISPAKKLDSQSKPTTTKFSQPMFLDKSAALVSTIRCYSADELSKIMGISPMLAALNAERFKAWRRPFQPGNAKQAILTFKGDVYLGLAAKEFKLRDLNFAQKNLRILSGLYGLLRPLDLIQPYRLEMGTRVNNSIGQNLYQYWHDDISEAIVDELKHHRNKTLINLASNEYFKAVRINVLPGKVITPVFKDYKNGIYKVISFFAKKARGAMAAYIVKNRLNKPTDIKHFNWCNYQYNDELSSKYEWLFIRH